VVPDALLDPRFADNPLTTGEPRVRFYAGCPLSVGGHRVGTLCLIDHRPRQLDEAQLHLLRDLANLVRQELAGPTAA
jgi:GAF domain-containing protein